MDRYSQGVKVPKIQVDKFIGKTSTGAGFIVLNLTYPPKSINDIYIEVGGDDTLSTPRIYRKVNLAGKNLTVLVIGIAYSKTTATSGASNSGGAGVDPHTHAITFTTQNCSAATLASEDQNPIVVSYAVG